MAKAGFFDRDRTIAGPRFNRWLIPPAALAIHLSIGQVYAFSVFNESLAASGDWALTSVGWIFSLAIVFLGLAAAFGGKWVERAGPRQAMFAAMLFFAGGFMVSALGASLNQLWIIYLGYGVLGGTGLGIGYISPVKTLMTWFPDRPGMATGMAIMGFGGGALVAAPLSSALLSLYSTSDSTGVVPTFVTLGLLYAAFMSFGMFTVRVPDKGWQPAGWEPEDKQDKGLVTSGNVTADEAIKTPQFWLLWTVLFVNVTAGIGVLGQAAVMIQETFSGAITAAAAAGFVGLLSLFNMIGRFGWSTTSDYIGRKPTYMIFLGLGAVLYALVPIAGAIGSVVLFVALFAVILSMYGGGFATIPAYLKDLFGTKQVGAIHGRVLTAWSAAGVAGPVLVNYIRQFQIDNGVAAQDAYNITMYLMAGLLVVGFLANWRVKEVAGKHLIDEEAHTAQPETEPAAQGAGRR